VQKIYVHRLYTGRYRAFSLPGQFAPRSKSANRTRGNSLPGPFAPGPFAPCPFPSLELSRHVYVAIYFLSSKFPGHFAPRSESSSERIGQGAVGRFAPGSELAPERKGCESAGGSLIIGHWDNLAKQSASIALTIAIQRRTAPASNVG